MSTALVPRYDPFVAMDQLDDELIVAELQGRVADALAYSFTQNGKTVTGLSKAGVDATVREMAKQGEVIRELSLDWRDNGAEVLFTAQAGRYVIKTENETGKVLEVLMDTAFGCKRQPKRTPSTEKHPQGLDNPFWFEQGAMKATRNARMRLIREDLKQRVIAIAAQEGKTRHIAEENVTTSPSPNDAPQTSGATKPIELRIPYGNAKGKSLAEASNEDLIWMHGQLTEAKLSEAQWGGRNRKLKAAIEAELDAREAHEDDLGEPADADGQKQGNTLFSDGDRR